MGGKMFEKAKRVEGPFDHDNLWTPWSLFLLADVRGAGWRALDLFDYGGPGPGAMGVYYFVGLFALGRLILLSKGPPRGGFIISRGSLIKRWG
jgi:hypothetical protein